MNDYWNHNTAYHPELLKAVPSRGARILDIGCGDGLLVEKLAARGAQVVGIDVDANAISQARVRLAHVTNARVFLGNFQESSELDGHRFDLITCVATLHHMPIISTLNRMQELLNPGGQLRVVGLSANKTWSDWVVSGFLLIPICVMSWLHRPSGYAGMATARPSESLREIRRIAQEVLPGARVRRRFYYRYTLVWQKPLSLMREG